MVVLEGEICNGEYLRGESLVVIKAKKYKEPLYNDSLVRPCSQYILETTCYIIYIRLKVVASVTARTKSHSMK